MNNRTAKTQNRQDMKTDNLQKAGRHPKIDPIAFRCSVNFTATEHAIMMAMFEKSGIESMAAFVKMQFFGNPFKVFTIDENTRIFIDKLSDFNARFKVIGSSYDEFVRTLRTNFTEKKAMSVLYNLEQKTIELIKVSREIMALAQKFDERWLQKSQ